MEFFFREIGNEVQGCCVSRGRMVFYWTCMSCFYAPTHGLCSGAGRSPDEKSRNEAFSHFMHRFSFSRPRECMDNAPTQECGSCLRCRGSKMPARSPFARFS